MIPIWLALLLSWGVFAIVLFVADNLQWLSFHSEIVFHLFCAPILIPIYAIGFPIALCIRCFRELKFKISRRKFKSKK